MHYSQTKLVRLVLSLVLLTSLTIAQKTKDYEESYSFSSTGTVSVDTYKGSITVETWNKDEVYFHAVVEPDTDGWNPTSPEEQLERCEVRVNYSENYLSLESDYKESHGWGSSNRAFVHYTIKMPATAELKIDDYKSDTKINNLISDLDLETYKGRVSINNFSGKLNLETYKGDVNVGYTELKENCSFDTYKGEVTLSLPSKAKFNFDFEMGKKGDYSSDFDMMLKKYDSDDGDFKGQVNGGGATIKFSTYKGEISLRERN